MLQVIHDAAEVPNTRLRRVTTSPQPMGPTGGKYHKSSYIYIKESWASIRWMQTRFRHLYVFLRRPVFNIFATHFCNEDCRKMSAMASSQALRRTQGIWFILWWYCISKVEAYSTQWSYTREIHMFRFPSQLIILIPRVSNYNRDPSRRTPPRGWCRCTFSLQIGLGDLEPVSWLALEPIEWLEP